MTNQEFINLRKEVSRISKIPLAYIEKRFPDYQSHQYDLESYYETCKEAIKNMNHIEVRDAVDRATEESKKKVRGEALKKYFKKKMAVQDILGDIQLEINILNHKNSNAVANFLETDGGSEKIFKIILNYLYKPYQYIANDYELNNQETENTYKVFVEQKRSEILGIIKLHLKLFEKQGSLQSGKAYELTDLRSLRRQMANLIIQYIRAYKKLQN
ncbi:hypothetical protein ACFL14_00300 [Patescibacteria group bacterium]